MSKMAQVTRYRDSEVFEARIPEWRKSQALVVTANDVTATLKAGVQRPPNIHGSVVWTDYMLEHRQ